MPTKFPVAVPTGLATSEIPPPVAVTLEVLPNTMLRPAVTAIDPLSVTKDVRVRLPGPARRMWPDWLWAVTWLPSASSSRPAESTVPAGPAIEPLAVRTIPPPAVMSTVLSSAPSRIEPPVVVMLTVPGNWIAPIVMLPPPCTFRFSKPVGVRVLPPNVNPPWSKPIAPEATVRFNVSVSVPPVRFSKLENVVALLEIVTSPLPVTFHVLLVFGPVSVSVPVPPTTCSMLANPPIPVAAPVARLTVTAVLRAV